LNVDEAFRLVASIGTRRDDASTLIVPIDPREHRQQQEHQGQDVLQFGDPGDGLHGQGMDDEEEGG